MLEKINKLSNRQVVLVILIVGLIVFCTGLFNPFQGDDSLQIVKNVPVHSLTNIKLFFEGGTLYNGGGVAPLVGDYRPLMTTAFSLIYTFFGLHTFFYHFFQLLLYASSAVFLFLIFKQTFKTVLLPLILSLIFLVHPLNSQVALAIPSMQDVLFFFFGILGFYILISYKSVSRLWLVSLCFLLSMLSKETGILFIGLALLYLFWWSRKRFFTSIAFMVVPAGLWLALRLNAVGLNNPNIAPIDRLNLVGRLLTLPSILLFYLAKFIFPWKLASGYYWVHPTFSARYVLVPLLIDLAVLGIAIYLGFAVHRKASKTLYHKYLFFSVWLVLGLLTLSQIITLDMTASETWFYFSMSGLLGMIGVAVKTFSKKINPSWLMAIALLLIVLLGFRTLMRGIDWNNKYHLDKLDIAASRQDYVADNDIANILIGQHKYAAAKVYADQSIAIFPYFGNYNNLSTIYLDSGNIAEAKTIFDKGLGYGRYVDIYDNLGEISLVQGNVNSNRLFFAQALNLFPEDGQLWFYKALFDGEHNDNTDAKTDINNAVNFGYPVNQIIYRVIMNGQILAIHTNLGVINLQ